MMMMKCNLQEMLHSFPKKMNQLENLQPMTNYVIEIERNMNDHKDLSHPGQQILGHLRVQNLGAMWIQILPEDTTQILMMVGCLKCLSFFKISFNQRLKLCIKKLTTVAKSHVRQLTLTTYVLNYEFVKFSSSKVFIYEFF